MKDILVIITCRILVYVFILNQRRKSFQLDKPFYSSFICWSCNSVPKYYCIKESPRHQPRPLWSLTEPPSTSKKRQKYLLFKYSSCSYLDLKDLNPCSIYFHVYVLQWSIIHLLTLTEHLISQPPSLTISVSLRVYGVHSPRTHLPTSRT